MDGGQDIISGYHSKPKKNFASDDPYFPEDVPRARVRSLRRRGEPGTAALLLSTVSAGVWPRARLHEFGFASCPTCPRCGLAPETQVHRVWECTSNEGAPFLRSARLQPEALRGVHEWPCFWLRGLLPHEWLPPLPPPSSS